MPGGHDALLGRFIDVAYLQENGLEAADQSALNMIYQLGYQPDPRHFSDIGVSDERYHIEGGNQRLPEAIATHMTSLAPQCTIRQGWRMTAIARNDDESVTLEFATADGAQSATFDTVSLALPFSVLRTLDTTRAAFDPLKRLAIGELVYATNSKLQLQFADRFWRRRGPWLGISTGAIFTDLALQYTWEVSRGQPGAAGIIVDYTSGYLGAGYQPDGPYTTTDDSEAVQRYAKAFLAQLEQIWPSATTHYTGTATLSYPTGDPNLLGSYSTYAPGQLTRFGGYEGVRQGNIHFAGEHCSADFQGFMNGGAEEGARAAREVLADLGAGGTPVPSASPVATSP